MTATGDGFATSGDDRHPSTGRASSGISAALTVGRSQVVAPVSRRLFGSFIEHLGRAVYGGIFEPGHPTADADGFRGDVIELVKELGISTVRYPGGNFVSAYRWEDGVGPKDRRPRRLDPAWHSVESNQVGLDEFATWCRLTDTELMMAINLGTRGIAEALDLLEYTNHPGGTTLSDLRAANGHPSPHDVRIWCLGNEMDGPWQIGHMSAVDYGKLAGRTAAAMKAVDPALELVVCGSSGSWISTFGEWERAVLRECYPHVDMISCHAYYREKPGQLPDFLASSLDLQKFVTTIVGIADEAKAELGSERTLQLSFDEWNVWYHDEAGDAEMTKDWPSAPPLLENIYTVADAVVVGGLLITLLKNSDRVGSASLAQLVNAIAPIMTAAGGGAWRQTTFFPFALTSRHARGVVLAPVIEVPDYDSEYGPCPFVDAVATWDDASGTLAVFVMNRTTDQPVEISIDLTEFATLRIQENACLFDEDVHAVNSIDEPARVLPQPHSFAVFADGRLDATLPPVSWSVFVLGGGDREG